MAIPTPLAVLSVQAKNGIWSVNERGPSRVAIAYFPSKWGALKHAVKTAKAKGRTRVAVLERDGGLECSRDYASRDPGAVEVP